ncbi:MAG: hypothetical protein Q7Q73_00140 [Verrucomicrobiota bacterium JB024]|nr:hypothetical protein [Verrucomicrobiota bacterium JB024]
MRHCLSPQATLRARAHGFALIIAISLMAFIVLLLVSLSQFLRIETKMGTTQNAQIAARQNAVLGLKTAIGQLQLLAGPDQRVTATAGLEDSTPADAGISGVNEPYWTGVWNSTYPANTSVRNSAALATYRNSGQRDPQGGNKFLGWLVSDSDNANALNFDRNDADTAIQLVGEGSVEDLDTQGVFAPKVAIRDEASTTVGHYAYWVGDEGVKARFDAVDPHAEQSVASPLDPAIQQGKVSLLVAQRVGVENALDLNMIANSDETFEKAASQRQLGLLTYNTGGAPYAETQTKNAFHSVSFASAGVLANVRDGGLKKDLTAYLSSNAARPGTMPTFDRNTVYDYTQYGVNTTPDDEGIADFPDPFNAFTQASPTWEQLRAFYQLSDRGTDSIAPRIRSATMPEGYPVGPILIRAELNLMPEFAVTTTPSTGPSSPQTITAATFNVGVAVRVALWNPYNVPLSAHNYEVELMVRDAAAKLFPLVVREDNTINAGGQLANNTDTGANAGFAVLTHGNSADYGVGSTNMDGVFQHSAITHYLTDDPDEVSVSGFVFQVNDITLQPGQVMIYTLSGDADYNGENELVELATATGLGIVRLPYGDVKPQVDAVTYTTTDVSTGTTTTHIPHFVWRNWDTFGDSAQGTIASMALLEPVNTVSESRDLFDTTTNQVVGLDRYYSRLRERPVTRVELDNTGGGISTLTIDALSVPTVGGATTFSVNGSLYPVENENFNLDETPVMLTHNNALAREAGPSGLNLDVSNLNQAPYIIPGWGGAVRYDYTSWDYNGSLGFFGRNESLNALSNPVIAELPPRDIPIPSLGFFQHARLMENSLGPTFKIGNSYPDVFIANLEDLERSDDANYDADDRYPAAIDSTYLLNDALWDPFFLSTVENPVILNDDPANTSDGPDYYAVNSRMRRPQYIEDIPGDQLNDFFDFAAANLMVEGAFNVNSVDVAAWKAFLGSMGNLALDPATGAPGGTVLNRYFSHLAFPTGDEDVASTEANIWTGYRTLDDAELTSLAEQMVQQVKTRGPFFSLSEFVNRNVTDTPAGTGQRGALQAAIDASIVNDAVLDNPSVANNQYTDALPDPFLQEGSNGYHYDATTGWITQGDVLQALGPFLAARSDTFLIRSYGDAVDPLNPDALIGKAWCEAIVQRVPDPVVRASDDATDPDYYEPDDPDTFGRQFKIIAFRWIPEDEV